MGKTGVKTGGLIAVGGLIAIAALTRANADGPAPAVTTAAAADGSLEIPAFRAPYSELASDAARRHFVAYSQGFARLTAAQKHEDPMAVKRQKLDDLLMRPGLERLRGVFPVDIAATDIGGVQTDIVTPRGGVSPENRNRILINLHGGGFTGGARWGGQQEAVPIASLGSITVITVDYRMAPEHAFPAASEDVAAVYRGLLKRYRPENIGIYGCSAGAALTGQSVAWFQKHGLPKPGAIGLFGGTLSMEERSGDSSYIGLAFGGFGGVPLTEPRPRTAPRPRNSYFKTANLSDPLVSPGASDDVLKKFPSTLLISGTRDVALSETIQAHARLVRAGVDARLHIWEGAPHCSFAQPIVDPTVPETREAWDVIVKFFDTHLDRRPLQIRHGGQGIRS